MQILKNGGYIDFYVNKKKYENYKTEKGKLNLVYRTLNNICGSLAGKTGKGLEIREVSFTSNSFWGNKLNFINDIGYSDSNKVELNEDKLTVRFFGIDVISVVTGENFNSFPTLTSKNFEIKTAFSKII